jgi:hypothetical protein
VNEQQPVFANTPAYFFISSNQVEWMAFVRNGRNICVRHTASSGSSWSDSIYSIPNDSAQFSHPSLAYTRVLPGGQEMVVLVWESSEYPLPGSNLMYTTFQNGVWGQPMFLTSQGAGDRKPFVAPFDSGAVAVWERNGRILYSRYIGGVWSAPEFVTPAGDTLNSNPQVFPQGATPIVLWSRRKDADTTFAVMCTIKRQTGWKQPDTVAYAGDNRKPSFFKAMPSFVTWHRASGSYMEVVACSVRYSNDVLQRGNVERISQAGGIYTNAAINGSPIPVPMNNPNTVWYAAGTWQASLPAQTAIVARAFMGFHDSLFVAPLNSVYQHPAVSAGTWATPYVWFWIVWEKFDGTRWSLYGSNFAYNFTDVAEKPRTPPQFTLDQNYPNPFNPMTNIKFQIPSSNAQLEFVSLKVFDVLGREVATLVNEAKPPGEYSVTFDASNLPSGMYYYRFSSGNFTQTRKMILMR